MIVRPPGAVTGLLLAQAAGVRFLTEPRREPYGQVAVFLDLRGNRCDQLGPA